MTRLDISHIPRKKYSKYDHTVGLPYEKLVCKYLNDNGLYAFQPDQPGLKGRDLRRYQTDICFELSGRYVGRMEVKSRDGKPFRWRTIKVGACDGIDAKIPEIDLMVVICQETGETRVCKASRRHIESKWLRTKDKEGDGYSYEVPRTEFFSLEYAIQYIKNLWSYYKFLETVEDIGR